MHRIHFSPDAKKVSSCTMIFFLLNLATLIHSTMPLTYLASFLQTGLQTNAQRLPGDSSVFVHHSSTFPSPTKGTSFSKLKRKTHKQSYTSISPQGFCKLYMTQSKMQTKQKHPLQFYFKFLNNFPCLHINPQTNTELHCIPKTKYTFQGHCTPCWDCSQRS